MVVIVELFRGLCYNYIVVINSSRIDTKSLYELWLSKDLLNVLLYDIIII
jgi:hypothetical protein